MFCGQEIGNLSSFPSSGAPSDNSSSLCVKGVARNGSPPWREDDKDGHYMFELGDDLTPRCNPTFLLPSAVLIILKLPFKFF